MVTTIGIVLGLVHFPRMLSILNIRSRARERRAGRPAMDTGSIVEQPLPLAGRRRIKPKHGHPGDTNKASYR